jgi:CheY-like chemotaxis protein
VASRQAGLSLLSLIDNILDLSKIESGIVQTNPVDYSLSALINDVTSIIRIKTADSRLHFVAYVDSNLPNELFGDEIRIRQVLINLLGNAVKYTNEGYVMLSVRGEMADSDTVNIILEVKDSGIGIVKEDIDKVFLDYYQLDTNTSKEKEGVGLGLAISWNIVKLMDGDIEVESEYGKGSTFTVTFPQKTRGSEKVAAVNAPEDISAVVYASHDICGNSIMYAIDNLGVKCTLAKNAEDFFDILEREPPVYVFIARPLLEENIDRLKLYKNIKIVLLIELGESIPVGNWTSISMPISSISIADVLNGVTDRHSYDELTDQVASFTAPEARVLVVDDINTNLEVASGLLSPYLMEIDLRSSGAAAIEAIKANRYDIVFMDHLMPDMDGVEATKHIRELGINDIYYKELPIIALTANAVTGAKEMFLQNGFSDFLSKPIDTGMMNTILGVYIHKDKQKAIAAAGKHGGKTEQLVLPDFEIEGLDIVKGIWQTGGSTRLFCDTLSVFLEDGREKIDDIKSYLDSGNLSRYVTVIHALKSASANIGAYTLPESAYALEIAGQKGDLDFIEQNNGQFMAALERLLSGIEIALLSYNRSRQEGSSLSGMSSAGDMKEELTGLKKALQVMDAAAIFPTVDKLLEMNLPDEAMAIIRRISKHVMMVEYDEADALIDSLLE